MPADSKSQSLFTNLFIYFFFNIWAAKRPKLMQHEEKESGRLHFTHGPLLPLGKLEMLRGL